LDRYPYAYPQLPSAKVNPPAIPQRSGNRIVSALRIKAEKLPAMPIQSEVPIPSRLSTKNLLDDTEALLYCDPEFDRRIAISLS
jgi:hypothetical protein